MAIQTNFPAVKPSLLLDFANTKKLDPRITFTRTTTATYYDGVTTAKAEENLLTYSQEFDNTTAWGLLNSTVSANTLAAPDGTMTADSLVENTAAGQHGLLDLLCSIVSGQIYTLSIFAKANTATVIQLIGRTASFGTNIWANFNLSTGVVGSVGSSTTASIVSVGSGWYRCSITGTAPASATGGMALELTNNDPSAGRLPSYTGSNQSLYIWGAQIEQRSSVTAYTATTTQAITNYIPMLLTAASGVARFQHNPTTDESLGLLVEEARTNLATYSEQFDNAAWAKVNVTQFTNAIIAPDSTLTGEKFIATTTNSTHYNGQSVAFTSGTTYTFSVFLKAGEYIWTRLWFGGTAFPASNRAASFNLSTGTVGQTPSGVTATMTSVGNGWYRCSISVVATSSTTDFFGFNVQNADNASSTSFAGNDFNGIYIWGAQLEAGAYPTSYIPTVAATVTRNADAANMTGSNFTSWFNNAEGTIYVEGSHSDDNSTFPRFYTFSDGTISNTLQLLTLQSSNTLYGEVKTAGVAQAGLSINTAYTGQLGKVILSYKVNDFASCFNQGSVITDATGTVPVLTVMRLGAAVNGTSSLNGTIKKLAYYPLRLTNANLQALTT